MPLGDTVQTKEREKIKVVIPPPKKASQKTAKRIKDKYKNITRNKIKSLKIVGSNKKNKILKETDTIDEIKTASDKKRTKVAAQKILKKYKNLKRPKKTYLVNEEDIDYIEPQEDLFAVESIVNVANKVLDFEQFKKEQERELKKGKKGKQIAAKNILKKYKNLKKPKKRFLVNEEDLETIDYTEPQEDLFLGESIVNAANNVLDFEQFKKEQEKKIREYNDRLLEDTKTINYVDDLDLKDVRENKNSKISAKKISDKYKKNKTKKKTSNFNARLS